MIKIKGMSREEISQLLPDNLILLAYRGSIAHGMYVPQDDPDSIDDKDLMGTFVAPVEHYLGFGRKDHKEKFIGCWDAVSYEIRKLIGLLLKNNPNVLSLLWVPESKVVYSTPLGDLLRANRHMFVSKAAYHSFAGYAHSQFKRMTRGAFQGHMGAKRKELVERFGFDCKNASHLIRLLKMCIEFLVEGELYVERKDAAQLLAIKRGEWTLEKVKEEAERLFALAEEAYIRSGLQAKPDREKAERLCMEIVRSHHNL